MTELDEVRALVHRYADAVCRDDRAAWIDRWAEGAVWEIGRGPVQGRAAIAAAFARAMDLFDAVVQLAHNGEATLDEAAGTGHGRWYMSEACRTRTGKNLHYLGYYDDRYQRGEDGAWRFTGRTLTWLYQGPADLSGTFGPPAGYERR